MVYLNEGIFKPALVLESIIFLPITIACCILTITRFRVELFVVSSVLFLVYFMLILCIYKYSKSKRNYLMIEDNSIVINYPSRHNHTVFKIDGRSIIRVEYYRISSLRSWCMLYNYVCPQCVYITYLYEGREVCEHIGYPKLESIKELCLGLGVEVIFK